MSTQSGFKMGLCQYPEMGRKVGKNWVFGCKSGPKCAKTNFLLTLSPLWDSDKTPFLTQFQGWKLFFFQKAP